MWHQVFKHLGVGGDFFLHRSVVYFSEGSQSGTLQREWGRMSCYCDDRFPSPWIHWLRAVIFTQTAPLTMFTTINPVTIHGSLVTVRALV